MEGAEAGPGAATAAGRPQPLPRWKAWLPSVLVLAAASVLALLSLRDYERERDQQFERSTKAAAAVIKGRAQDYGNLLRGAAGFVGAGAEFSRERWRVYVAGLDLMRSYPGAQGLGYTASVPAAQRGEFLRSARAGMPEYAIRPAGDRPHYFPVVSTEPLRPAASVLGYDQGVEPRRRACLEEARDAGEPRLSAPVELQVPAPGLENGGFILAMPVYRGGEPPQGLEARRAAVRGFVVMPLRLRPMLEGALLAAGGLGLTLRESGEQGAAVLFGAPLSGPERTRRAMTVHVHGRDWVAEFQQPAEPLSAPGRREPLALLALGLILGGLVRLLVRGIDNTRAQAEALALSMTAELRRTDELRRAVFLHSSLPIGVTGPDGLILDVNPAMEEVMGRRREEMLGRSWADLSHPEDRELGLSLLRQVLDGHMDCYQLEKRYLHKSGRPFWAQVSVGVMRGEDGLARLFIGTLRDVTARRAAEAAEAERQALYRAMFEDNRSVSLLVDPQTGRIVDANHAAAAFYGYSRESMQGMPIGTINILPVEQLLSAMRQAGKGGGVFHFTHRLADGSLRSVRVQSGRFDSRGQELLLSSVQDVTDRVRAEAALQESRGRFQALVESMDQGVALLDGDGKVTYANPAFARMLGGAASEFCGRDFAALMDGPQDAAQGPGGAARLPQAAWEAFFPVAGGDRLLARITPFPLKDEEGRVLGSCALVANIAAQRAEARRAARRRKRRAAMLALHGMRGAGPGKMLDYALGQALALTDSALGAVFRYDGDERSITLMAWSREVMERCGVGAQHGRFLLHEMGLWGDAVRTRQPVLLNEFASGEASLRLPEGHAPLHSFLAVPVVMGGRVRAVVGVANGKEPYSQDDAVQLQLFAESFMALWEHQEAERARRKAEEELERSHRFLQTIIDTLPHTLFCKDVQGRFLLVNKAFVRLRGLSEHAEILGRCITELDPPEAAALHTHWDQKCLQSGVDVVHSYEYPVELPAGGVSHRLVHKRLVDLPDGSQGIVGVNVDNTSRKLAEQSLLEEQRRLTDVLEGTRAGVWERSAQSGEMRVNERWEAISGHGPGELGTISYGRLRDMTHPADLPRVESLVARHLAGELPCFDCEHRTLGKDGQWIWVHDRGRVVRFAEDGSPLIMRGTRTDINDRKQAEERLALVARFPVESPSPVLRADARGAIMFMNPAAGPLLADWGADLGSALPPELKAELDLALSDGQTRSSERSYPSGVYSFTVTPFVDQGYANIYALDVSQRKAAELSLKQSELRNRELASMLRLMCDNVPGMIWAKDRLGRYLFANKALCEQFLGLADPQQAIGRTDADFLADLDGARPDSPVLRAFAEAGRPTDQAALRGEGPGQYECSGSLNGELRHFDVRKAPLLNDQGVAIGTVGTARDITDRRQAQQALAESEERFRTLAEVSPVGIFQADERGRCTYVNERWSAISGMPGRAALGLGWLSTLRREDRSGVFRGFREALAAGRDFTTEFRFRGAVNDDRWVLVRGASLKDAAGRFSGFVGALTDISELKRVEAALRQAKAEAEAATRAKAMFLANMSHEIRTPLAGLIGPARLLAQAALTPEQRRLADMAVQSGRALLAVVNDILDFSKIEAGRMTLRPAPFSLRRLVESEAGPAAFQARERGLDLGVELEEDVPDALVGDAARLGQVLRNLLGNALKFTERGGVSLSVSLDAADQKRARLRFRVEDSGLGIARDYLPRLFESFTQADDSYDRNHGGTGLGLAICKNLVEQMGGRIWANSEPGRGSVFTFTAAFARCAPSEIPEPPATPEPPAATEALPEGPDAPRAQEPAAALAPQTPAQTPGRGLRVLLAEDNAIGRVLMEHVLSQAGHSVKSVGDGVEVLRALRQEPFDVVLMDVQMPRMDGLSATRRIRSGAAGPERAGIAVVALTAYASVEDRKSFLDAGMDDEVSKPVDEPLLFAAMEHAVRTARRRARTDAPQERPAARLDADYIARAFGGAPELLQLMLRQFKDASLPELRAGLLSALEAGSVADVAHFAHRSRGTLGAIGAVAGAELAARLEQAARDGDPARVEELGRALLTELEVLDQNLAGEGPWRWE